MMIWSVVPAYRMDRLTMQMFADRSSLDRAEIPTTDIVVFVGSLQGCHFITAISVAHAPVITTGAAAQRIQPVGLVQEEQAEV